MSPVWPVWQQAGLAVPRGIAEDGGVGTGAPVPASAGADRYPE